MDAPIVSRRTNKCADCGAPIDKRSARCNACRGLLSVRVTESDYHNLALSKGYEWLGPYPKNVSFRTRWRCASGHEWEAAYANLRGCDACWNEQLGQIKRLSPQDYLNMAEEAGVTWLGPEVTTTQHHTRWMCPKGHIWSTGYETLRKGRRCPECQRLHAEDYHALAARRDFLWVDKLPENSKTPTLWQCGNGHAWRASYNNVSRGSKCPECVDRVNSVRVSSQQRALAAMTGGILNYRVGRYSVDVALIHFDANVAIEYDAYYWHAKQAERDAKKTQRLIDKGWKVLRIKAGRMLPTSEQVGSTIALLLQGDNYQEIVLEDWHEGD